jgi:hypothetical protein
MRGRRVRGVLCALCDVCACHRNVRTCCSATGAAPRRHGPGDVQGESERERERERSHSTSFPPVTIDVEENAVV